MFLMFRFLELKFPVPSSLRCVLYAVISFAVVLLNLVWCKSGLVALEFHGLSYICCNAHTDIILEGTTKHER
jgi:hypothetical protein